MLLPPKKPRTPPFQACWTPSHLSLAKTWDQSQALIYDSQIRHLLAGPTTLKIHQSPPTSILCCPRHVVFPSSATVLPLSLSLPLPEKREKLVGLAWLLLRGERSARARKSYLLPEIMDGEGSWNVALCGGAGGARDKTIINRVMLRFRPIAPKPATGASAYGGYATENKSKALLSGNRTKRKYVRVRRNSGYRRRNSSKSSEELEKEDGLENAVMTLQLLPEKVDTAEGSVAGGSWCKNVDLDLTVEKLEIQDNWKISPSLSNIAAEKANDAGKTPDRTAEIGTVDTWVTVESVTDTCMDARGLGCTDVEKVKNLESDTCPGIISDGFNRVKWVNEAFRRMVSNEKDGNWPDIRVWLKTKKEIVLYSHQAFTCGVRLQYTWQNEKCTKMVPCDVWRMECGGFAWRLDIKAALSLGL